MKIPLIPSLITFLSILNLSNASQSCTTYTFSGNNSFKSCLHLPVLNSYLHWTYNDASATVDLAYRRTGISARGRWVSWGINPLSVGMVGSQCIVAAFGVNGTVTAYTSPVTSYSSELTEGRISVNVSGLKAVYDDMEVVLFVTLEVSGKKTKVNHVWQDGPLSENGVPLSHVTEGPNMMSSGRLDFLAGFDQIQDQSYHKRLNNDVSSEGVKVMGILFFPFYATLICSIVSSSVLFNLV